MSSPVPLAPDFVRVGSVQFRTDDDFATIRFECTVDLRNLGRYIPNFTPHRDGEKNLVSESFEITLARIVS